jgi:hypothetical protein
MKSEIKTIFSWDFYKIYGLGKCTKPYLRFIKEA